MSYQHPPLNRKTSAPWDRLRPVKQDPLESVGFVSKGDNRLLNLKTQESYYHKITARYMQFCTTHSKDLDEAFRSLSVENAGTISSSADAHNSNARSSDGPATTSTRGSQANSSRPTGMNNEATNKSAEELSMILTALRKLREGILATSNTATSPLFSQRVHIFNIRLAILALHPESYHASLRYLLFNLHTQDHPLPQSELREMMCYLILDTALRLGDVNEAHKLRLRARVSFELVNRDVDQILRAVAVNNWPMFWRVRNRVDGYMRAIMHHHLATIRKTTLKTIAKSYMKCDIKWILQSATGGELDWEELVLQEDVGWLRDKDVAIIRKPKART